MGKNIDIYEWSPNGLQMLQDIENSIRGYGGRGRLLFALESEKHKGYTCAKENCDFCERFKLVTSKPTESKNTYLLRPTIKIQPQIKFQKRDFSTKNFKY